MVKLMVSVVGIFLLLSSGRSGAILVGAVQPGEKQIVDVEDGLAIVREHLGDPVEYRFYLEMTHEVWDADGESWVWSSTDHSTIQYYDEKWIKKGVYSAVRGPNNKRYESTLSEMYSQENGDIFELTRNGMEYSIPLGLERVTPPSYIPISTDRPPHHSVLSYANRTKSVLYFLTGQIERGKSFFDVIGFAEPKVRLLTSDIVEIICDSKEGCFKYQFSLKPRLMLRSLRFELGPDCTWDGKTLESAGVRNVICDTQVVGEFENRVVTRELRIVRETGELNRSRTIYRIIGLEAGESTKFWNEPPPIPFGTEVANMRQPLIDFVWTSDGITKLIGESSTLVGDIEIVDYYRGEEDKALPNSMLTLLVVAAVAFAIALFLAVREKK